MNAARCPFLGARRVTTAATLGIPVAIEVSRHLDLDDYLILQKTPKVHLADALAEPLSSMATAADVRTVLVDGRVVVTGGVPVTGVDGPGLNRAVDRIATAHGWR